MDTKSQFSPKIALYGIGFIGKCLIKVAQQKGWPVVAAYNRPGDKIGKDIGELAGLGHNLNVVVEDLDSADLSKLDADIAIISGPDFLIDIFPIAEKFIKSGLDVFSYGSHTYQPYWFYPDIAKKIDDLAQDHGVTFTGGGLWDMTRIWAGLISAGPCVKLESIEYLTTTDPSRQGTHWFPVVGIGMTIDEYDEKLGRDNVGWNGVYQALGVIILQYFGYEVTGVNMRQEPVTFDEPFYCKELEKELAPGICVGTRVLIEVQSKQGVSVKLTVELRLLKAGEEEHGTWEINGQPPMGVRVKRVDTGIASACSGLNRVADVLAAAPGIVTIMDMGPMKPSVQESSLPVFQSVS